MSSPIEKKLKNGYFEIESEGLSQLNYIRCSSSEFFNGYDCSNTFVYKNSYSYNPMKCMSQFLSDTS